TVVSYPICCHNSSARCGAKGAIIITSGFRITSLWQQMGYETTVNEARFPIHDESHLVESTINYPVCINGKKRAEASFPADAAREAIEKVTLEMESVQRWIDGKTVRKVIVVPKRMINIVVS
ncbi:MAG: leucine--tRNA ligase, partial [Bacteroidota bacterium]